MLTTQEPSLYLKTMPDSGSSFVANQDPDRHLGWEIECSTSHDQFMLFLGTQIRIKSEQGLEHKYYKKEQKKISTVTLYFLLFHLIHLFRLSRVFLGRVCITLCFVLCRLCLMFTIFRKYLIVAIFNFQ